MTKRRAYPAPEYEPPRALRIGDGRAAAGQCVAPGSGDLDTCEVGNNAGGNCLNPGSGFIGGFGCTAPGAFPESIRVCLGPGLQIVF
jgi:hypothetical protein